MACSNYYTGDIQQRSTSLEVDLKLTIGSRVLGFTCSYRLSNAILPLVEYFPACLEFGVRPL